MKTTLDKIEARIQAMIENRMPWLKKGARSDQLASRLLEAFQNSLQLDITGRHLAADEYVVFLHPDRLAAWQGQPDLVHHLTESLEAAADEAGVIFLRSPHIRMISDLTLAPDGIRVETSSHPERLGDTAAFRVDAIPAVPESDLFPQHAFLIINGSEIIPLRSAVINLGRRSDNHVVLDDPRVSRSHAQIRAIGGSFVLFDLNSTGGTFVNNDRISQYSLLPGDVISLSGVPVIYGEDDPGTLRTSSGSTSEFIP